jgi:hypothetical protein
VNREGVSHEFVQAALVSNQPFHQGKLGSDWAFRPGFLRTREALKAKLPLSQL